MELKIRGGYKLPRLEIVMISANKEGAEVLAKRRHWQARDIRLNVEYFENRVDPVVIRGSTVNHSNMKPFSWCQRLMEQIYVLHDGRMVQCCADWEQRSPMGDLNTKGLADIWHGDHYADYRRRFACGDIKGMICADCRKQDGRPGLASTGRAGGVAGERRVGKIASEFN